VRERDSGLYPTAKAAEEPDIIHPASMLGQVADAGEISMTGVVAPPDMLSIESAVHDVVISAFEEFSNMRQPMLRSTRRLGHRKIAKAVDYIDGLPSGDGSALPSLDDLAQVAGLSKYHFLRQFSQIVGMTPGSYMRTLRLCHAARKLRTSDMPILDIALSVGFADHPSFSRAFARHMGMTPSDYQKLGPI